MTILSKLKKYLRFKKPFWLETSKQNNSNDSDYYIQATYDIGENIGIQHLKDLEWHLTKKQQTEMLWKRRFFSDMLEKHDNYNKDRRKDSVKIADIKERNRNTFKNTGYYKYIIAFILATIAICYAPVTALISLVIAVPTILLYNVITRKFKQKNSNFYERLVRFHQRLFDISNSEIRDNALPILLSIHKSPLSSQRQKTWAESKTLKLLNYPEIRSAENTAILTDYLLDKKRPQFRIQAIQKGIEQICLDSASDDVQGCFESSMKHENDLLWRQLDPTKINEYLNFKFYDNSWIEARHIPYYEGKNSYRNYHKLMNHANKVCKHIEPSPVIIEAYNTDKSIFNGNLVGQGISMIGSIFYHFPKMKFFTSLATSFFMQKKFQIQKPQQNDSTKKQYPLKDAPDEFMQETEKGLKNFEKKYGSPEVVSESYTNNMQKIWPLSATLEGKLIIPPEPKVSEFLVANEIAHQYHGDPQMTSLLSFSILLCDCIYSNRLTKALSILLPVILMPIQKSCEKRADQTGLECLDTIDEKRESIASLLLILLKTFPFNKEILSRPMIAMHPYPNGIERIKRLCVQAEIDYEKDFLPYFAETQCHTYNKWKDYLHSRPASTAEKILSGPGHLINFYGDTMSHLMSLVFRGIRPVIRSKKVFNGENILKVNINSTKKSIKKGVTKAKEKAILTKNILSGKTGSIGKLLQKNSQNAKELVFMGSSVISVSAKAFRWCAKSIKDSAKQATKDLIKQFSGSENEKTRDEDVISHHNNKELSSSHFKNTGKYFSSSDQVIPVPSAPPAYLVEKDDTEKYPTPSAPPAYLVEKDDTEKYPTPSAPPAYLVEKDDTEKYPTPTAPPAPKEIESLPIAEARHLKFCEGFKPHNTVALPLNDKSGYTSKNYETKKFNENTVEAVRHAV